MDFESLLADSLSLDSCGCLNVTLQTIILLYLLSSRSSSLTPANFISSPSPSTYQVLGLPHHSSILCPPNSISIVPILDRCKPPLCYLKSTSTPSSLPPPTLLLRSRISKPYNMSTIFYTVPFILADTFLSAWTIITKPRRGLTTRSEYHCSGFYF